MLAAGAEVMWHDVSGLTPLHSAAWSGSVGVIPLLVDAGADIDAPQKGWDRETPLYQAAWRCHAGAVEILVESGANVNGTTRIG